MSPNAIHLRLKPQKPSSEGGNGRRRSYRGGIGRRRLVDEAAEPAAAEGDAEEEGEGIQLGREPSRAGEREV